MIGRPSNSSRTQPLPTVERKQYTIKGVSREGPDAGVGVAIFETNAGIATA
jgi:hypothetical protein